MCVFIESSVKILDTPLNLKHCVCYKDIILRSHQSDLPILKGHKEIIKSAMSDCMCTT